MKKTDSQIIQQNKILLGGQTINLRARQLIYVLASSMDKEKPMDSIHFAASDFLKFINNTPGDKWSDIYALTNHIFDHLNKNPILIKEPNKKDFIKINWLSRLGVVRGNIEARFSADIAEFLLYKQGLPYTRLLWDLRPYSSGFTARIMDLFQKYHNKSSGIEEFSFEYLLDDLKLFFGVHDRYTRFYDFEKRVLKTTEKELEENDLVPYWFNYEKIKNGRNVHKIRFQVSVRPKILLDMAPELKMWGNKNPMQTNIFESAENRTLSQTKKNVLERLLPLGVKEAYAQKLLTHLTNSQAVGYFYLVEYGVNRTLAFSLVKDYCSFGELIDAEHLYIKYTLDKIEEDRLSRIKDSKNGDTKKRITPDEKKGGLPKKILVEKQHFASFMEQLSTIRKEQTPVRKDKRGGNFTAIGNLLPKPK